MSRANASSVTCHIIAASFRSWRKNGCGCQGGARPVLTQTVGKHLVILPFESVAGWGDRLSRIFQILEIFAVGAGLWSRFWAPCSSWT